VESAGSLSLRARSVEESGYDVRAMLHALWRAGVAYYDSAASAPAFWRTYGEVSYFGHTAIVMMEGHAR
jgi:hypothetical protein